MMELQEDAIGIEMDRIQYYTILIYIYYTDL